MVEGHGSWRHLIGGDQAVSILAEISSHAYSAIVIVPADVHPTGEDSLRPGWESGDLRSGLRVDKVLHLVLRDSGLAS